MNNDFNPDKIKNKIRQLEAGFNSFEDLYKIRAQKHQNTIEILGLILVFICLGSIFAMSYIFHTEKFLTMFFSFTTSAGMLVLGYLFGTKRHG